LDNIDLGNAKKMGVYFKTIDVDKLYNELEINLPQMYMVNDERKKKVLLERTEKIEQKMINVMTDSKENIKNTVHVINNVNKQLIQNNLLLKMKIENMKQTYKNILNYCTNLQLEINSTENKESYEVLNNIISNLKSQVHKSKGE
jgi:Fe2+ transport system protein B